MSQPTVVKFQDRYFQVVADKVNWWKAYPVGGGFETYLPKRDCISTIGIPSAVYRGLAYIDGGTEYPCQANPHDRWNGWAKPYFDDATVMKIIEDYKCSVIDRLQDKMIVAPDEWNEPVEVTRTANGWLFDGWCWDVRFMVEDQGDELDY